MTDYAKEFDNLVIEFNEWLFSTQKDKGTTLTRLFNFIKMNPNYAKIELNPEQKEAIAFGADWKRICDTIDDIAEYPVEEENYARGMYDFYRREYIKYREK